MRRLWAYIILAFTALVVMGASFTNIFTKLNSNIEYTEGRELVFRISNEDETEFEDDTAVKEIADTMIERLEAQDVTQYRVSTQGLDTVKVELEQDVTSDYSNIETLLTFNGTLALTSKLDESVTSEEDELRTEDKAYMTTENELPVITIPVGKGVQKIYDIVKTYKDDENTEAAESTTEGEGEEATTKYTYYMYLWHDYDPDFDTYAKTQSGDEYDEHVAKKIFMRFNIDDITDQITDDEGNVSAITELKTYVGVQDVNGNESYEASEVKASFATARFYVNLLNASKLNYKVTYLYDNVIPAWTDELVKVGNNIAWSKTLIATLCAIAVLSLLLVVFYRLGALSIITCTLGGVFASLGMIVVFGAEFNAAALIGFIIVAIVGMVSGVIYSTKFKEECYRGRSLKKANSEGAKKSLLPIIDIHVVIVLIGVFSYLFGGSLMRGFAAITVLGGLISLLINILALRGMMWLATNTTKLQGNYEIFGVDQEKVPNVIKEEKQQYFGPYADREITKKAKPVGILSCLLVVAGITGLIVCGAMNKGVIFNNGSTSLNTQIYVETETKNTLVNLTAVEEVLDTTYIYKGTDEANAKKLSTYVTLDSEGIYKIDYKTRTDTDAETKDTITYTYYVIQLNTKEIFGEEYHGYYTVKVGELINKVYDTDGIQDLIEKNIGQFDSESRISIKQNTIVSSYRPDFLSVFWGTLVGVAVSAFYLILRYRLSRGLIALIAPLATSTAITGIFALTRLPVTSYAAVAIPFVAIFTLILAIIFMNKERELVLEDKAHDRSIDNRAAIMKRATSLAAYPMLVATILAAYLGINFFGFGAVNNSWLFLIITVGMLLSLVIILPLYGPLSQILYKLFFPVDTEKFTSKFRRKKKVKKNQTPRNKSAEPEEYTFIGIND